MTKIISYYTRSTPYEQVAKEFIIPSCKKWNLDAEILAIEDKGSWQANTGIKGQLIKDSLLKYKEPVWFVDCDAEIVKYPELLFRIPKEIDLGYCHFNWFGHWRGQWENTSNIQLLTGTMYWAYNEKILALLDEWINKVQSNLQKWEQIALEEIVYARNDLNIFKVPYEYCCVVKQDYSIPNYIKEPVIVHWQKSRLYKRWWQEQKRKQIEEEMKNG